MDQSLLPVFQAFDAVVNPEDPFQVQNAEILVAGIPVIVAIGVMSQGMILTGQRRDNGLWTFPGGHMDAGEMPRQAAVREVLEETGIELGAYELTQVNAERIKSHRTGKEFAVLCFTVHMPEPAMATNAFDPDAEIMQWKWVKLSADSFELHPNMRHAFKDSILDHLGLWPKEGKMQLTEQEQWRLEEILAEEPILTCDKRFMKFIEQKKGIKQHNLRAATFLERLLDKFAEHVVHGPDFVDAPETPGEDTTQEEPGVNPG